MRGTPQDTARLESAVERIPQQTPECLPHSRISIENQPKVLKENGFEGAGQAAA